MDDDARGDDPALTGLKARLRAAARDRRRQLDQVYRQQADAVIRDRVAAAVAARGWRSVGLYAALPGEVDLDDLARRLLDAGMTVAFPRITGPGEMQFAAVTAVPTLRRGTPPIREPDPDLPAVSPEVVVVPGLAFDVDGRRLGQGGGFYDRWLAAARAADGRAGGATGVWAIGVCRDRELVGRVPAGPRDAIVDAVVTEGAVYRCGDAHV